MEKIEQKHKAKISSCSACGTAPVNHTFFYVQSLVEESFTKFTKIIFSWTEFANKPVVTNFLSNFLFGTFKLIGVLKYSDDISLAQTGRSELIWLEAKKRGIIMQQIFFLKKPTEQFRAKISNRWYHFESLPIPPKYQKNNSEWVDDKFILAKRLNKKNIPVPKAESTRSFFKTLKTFEKLDKPVIIKPRNGSRGRHTTTNISTKDELENAYKLAKMIAHTLVIEEHLFGNVCRATLINGKLCGFFRAEPPRVTGDGIHTINELIQLKNANRPSGISDIITNEDILSFIKRQGYNLDSVLPEAKTIDLTAKTGRFLGGNTEEMLSKLHPKFIDFFESAAKVVRIPIVGFDAIILDPTKDPESQKWGIIEANTLPFIDLHYYAHEGPANNLAIPIWDLWN